jgi:1-acyl-sn-glycerol-3-phosphate acyltransferase
MAPLGSGGMIDLFETVTFPGRLVGRVGALGATWWRMRGWSEADPLKRAAALQGAAQGLCADNGVVIERRGVVPPPGCVVVANHVSYVDTIVLPSVLPCTCIAKSEVAGWPLIGAMTRQLGVLFVVRDSAWSGAVVLRRAIRALRAGVSVVGFPEGTTTAGEDLLPFKRGMFGLARRLGRPVVAATIAYDAPELAWTGNTSFLGHYLGQVARRRRNVVRLSLSAPFDPRDFASGRAMAATVRAYIGDELRTLGRRPVAQLYAAPSGRTTSLPTPSA